MNNEPVGWAWLNTNMAEVLFRGNCMEGLTPLYTNPMRELTDEEIAKVVYELKQKANDPNRWVTTLQMGAETIIQLRKEISILKKARE